MVTAEATRPVTVRTLADAAWARVPQRSDRPAWIRLLAALVVLAALATAVVEAVDATGIRASIDLLGHHTAPNVAATEDLSVAFADMDAQLADLLLAGGANRAAVADTRRTYEQRRSQADGDLRQAISATGSEVSHGLLDQLGQYEALAAQIMLLNDTEQNPAGRPSGRILVLQRQATDLMARMQLDTQRLANDNKTALDSAYTATRRDTTDARVQLMLLGAVLLGALIALQVLLRVTMRRRLNPALLAATAVAAALVGGSLIAGADAAHQLKVAKQDAFESLLTLQRARAYGYDSNADESRWLLDPQRAATYEQGFLDQSQWLLNVHVKSVFDYDDALRAALTAYRRNNSDVRFTGFFADELGNITFPGERNAVDAMLLAFQAYQRDDRSMRALAAEDLGTAISFDTSADPGQSDGDFAFYDDSLNKVVAINQRAFDAAVTDGIDTLSGWNRLLPYSALALIAVLVFLGVRPRLAEYR
ncbi:hypothetical protein [Nocardia sp. alder85J]|uniref:hypothetical protein n=1 Tax=Nocardia sp. alder85J TaxID=2862949 RepID=UPI001CD6FDF3|nr:hypothetical protein [Nocardia sp. alder85J]MCX4096147.1 hypothetical protein [Nocardia sp. alder85J]